MSITVERYLRKKFLSKEDSPKFYYVRQKMGENKSVGILKMAELIESKSSLTKGDVKHALEEFVEVLRDTLVKGDKVKIEGLGTFHLTLGCKGVEEEKDCTVRCIHRVNLRFVPARAIKLVNASLVSTDSPNNVVFELFSPKDKDGKKTDTKPGKPTPEAPNPLG